MVTGYNPGCVFAPGKPLILHTKNHIYTNFNTPKNLPIPAPLGFFLVFLSCFSESIGFSNLYAFPFNFSKIPFLIEKVFGEFL